MRIRKHKNGNQYLFTEGGWVRNFTSGVHTEVDINPINRSEHRLLYQNEFQNMQMRLDKIEPRTYRKVVIVSNGYKFLEKQALLKELSNDVCIFGVNGALRDWDLTHKKAMNYYVVNNPYPECMLFLPNKHSYFPRCIASARTYPEFIKRYNGYSCLYSPVAPKSYLGPSKRESFKIDDSRNPICAAISLAYRFGASQILLFCCDDTFERDRPASVELKNGLRTYPQQLIAHQLIDGYLYWLRNQKFRQITIADCSSGPKYDNADYISFDDVTQFFKE